MPYKSNKTPKIMNERLNATGKKINDDLIPKGVYAAATQGVAFAKMHTPIDTSNLINSQYIESPVNMGDGWRVNTGYTANYAVNVEYAKGVNVGRSVLRDSSEPNRGYQWDPDGKPHFLRLGFEENLDIINNVFYKAIRL